MQIFSFFNRPLLRAAIQSAAFGMLVIGLLAPHALMAQRLTQTIQSIEGWQGQVQYDYQLKGLDTVLHGSYLYEVLRSDSTNTEAYQARELKGEFMQGKKEGNWVYRLTDLQKNGQKRVRGFVVEELANGTESVILAQFNAGLAA